MGRRSLHTADELRELIIEASTDLIRGGGLSALSAREIARRINYSPGTLYNSFENLDDLVLTIESRLLDALLEELSALPEDGAPRERVLRIAHTYLGFTAKNPKLWNLLFEHHIPQTHAVPEGYQQKFEALLGKVEEALRPLAEGADDARIKRSARVLWSGIHGISSLSAADKLAVISADDAGVLIDDLVSTYLRGLETR